MHPWYTFSMSPQELIVRGTLMYWALLLLFRFVLRRDTGSAGMSDILFVVLLGDAAQNGMIGQGDTVADALLLIAVLAAWNYLLDFLGARSRLICRLNDPPPILLVRDGRLIGRNLRREHISRAEGFAAMRDKGIEDLGRVRKLYLESNGEFSVLRYEAK